MLVPTEAELAAAWRALSAADANDGWRFILLGRAGLCSLHAGRRSPGNEECLLVSFPGATAPGARQLPKGRGFEATLVDLREAHLDVPTLGLMREPSGSLELFSMMVHDLASALCRPRGGTAQEQLQLFLRRVATWQEFMQRPADQALSAEAETGLFGELLTLRMLMDAGLQPVPALDAWQGPEDGLHDFVLGCGGMEVKSSVATAGLPARIASLDQLDDAGHCPLFLCGQRLSVGQEGETLPTRIDSMRAELADTGALSRFEVRLLHAGYVDAHRDRYTRQYTHLESRIMIVDDAFPRLTAGTVHAAIRHACYELDLDLVHANGVTAAEALKTLGMI